MGISVTQPRRDQTTSSSSLFGCSGSDQMMKRSASQLDFEEFIKKSIDADDNEMAENNAGEFPSDGGFRGDDLISSFTFKNGVSHYFLSPLNFF